MKALALFAVSVCLIVGMLAQLVVTIATHPWLAVQWFVRPPTVSVVGRGPAPGVAGLPGLAPQGVPADQWPLMVQAAAGSGCDIQPADLAAIAKTESGFGANVGPNPTSGAFGYGQFMPARNPDGVDTFHAYGGVGDPNTAAAALPVMATILCQRGYATNRAAALNSYGGCVTSDCLGPGRGDYASYVDRLAQSFAPPAQPAASGIGAEVVALAGQWVAAHVPYAWGGSSFAGVDCSGLVMEVYAQLGVQLPHNAALQFNATSAGAVDPSQAQPGDLVFFHDTDPKDPGVDHVGIVVGDGQMIDAPTDGIPVRVESYTTAYWSGHLAGIHRVTTG